MNRPASSRLYWICQATGWGSFTIYVLIGYLATADLHAWDVVSIVFFNAVVCPAITHGLRRYMAAHGWLNWPMRRLIPRLAAFVLVTSSALTAAVALGVFAASAGHVLPIPALAGVSLGFTWAFTGWLVIYFTVHVRRRRDALQLELTVVSRDAQLSSLRAQLNPHFLFNCLNSLRHLILANPDRAVAMVTGLAELLRYSLASDRRDTVSLAEELQVVDEYLALEHVRFEERLRLERHVEPAALEARLPPMLVLTLVENAIKHGISEMPQGGIVRIDARVEDRRLALDVANTGRLRPAPGETGSGLRNARERLRLLYGETASLTLVDEAGLTHARLVMPMVLDLETPALAASR